MAEDSYAEKEKRLRWKHKLERENLKARREMASVGSPHFSAAVFLSLEWEEAKLKEKQSRELLDLNERAAVTLASEPGSAPSGEVQTPVLLAEDPKPGVTPMQKSGRNPDVVAKAIAARVRKSDYVPIYIKMWDWLEAGSKPAEFIHEHRDLLRGWHITDNYAFKMFNRVKRWREKKIELRRPAPGEPPTEAQD